MPPPKKVCDALAGAIEELRRQHDVARLVLLLQRADRGDADDPAHAERAQRADIRAMIQLVRQDAMAAPVPREKIDLPSRELAAEDDIRRRAERRLDGVLGRTR